MSTATIEALQKLAEALDAMACELDNNTDSWSLGRAFSGVRSAVRGLKAALNHEVQGE